MDDQNAADATEIRPRSPRATPHRILFRERTAPNGSPRALGLPFGMFGMLAAVLVIEWTLASAGVGLLDNTSYSWYFAARAVREQSAGCEILCFGDSLVKHGLASSVIESRTGRRTYNLSAAAGSAVTTEILLRRAYDAGARPRAIVFDLKPSLLAGGPRYRMRQWQEFLSAREAVALARRASLSAFALDLLLGHCLPSFRTRHEIRADVSSMLREEVSLTRRANAVCEANWSRNGGTNVATRVPGHAGHIDEGYHGTTLTDRFKVHRLNAIASRELVALAVSRGARAYLLVPPFVPELLERRSQTGAEAKYDEFLRELQSRHPSLTILDARRSGYPASVFVDASHLDGVGAEVLSRGVAEVLKNDLEIEAPAEKRWIRLPDFRAPADAPLLEDFEQSRERLGITLAR